MENSDIYEVPQKINDIAQCYFYHTMDLPGYGTVEGDWDLRKGMDKYLGNVDFKDQRVLEFGKANGALSFEMEKRGADVVGFDLSADYNWDIVPYAQYDYLEKAKQRVKLVEKLNNAFWFAHNTFNSRVKVVYGNLYHVPDKIGMFDIATYGAILLHVRDTFLALQRGLKLVKDTVIVTDLLGQPADQPYMKFLPDAKNLRHKAAWWLLTPAVVKEMIGVLGFEDSKIILHDQMFKGEKKKMFTVVGKRTHGLQGDAK